MKINKMMYSTLIGTNGNPGTFSLRKSKMQNIVKAIGE